MTPDEFRTKVVTITRGYQMTRDIEECAEMAARMPLYLPVLQKLLSEFLSKHDWSSPQLSRTLHILIHSGTSSSLFYVLDFVKKLPESVPFALVELLGNLLPSYRKIVLGPAKELCEFQMGSPQRAVGIQLLCNLHLEGLLPLDNLNYLASLLSDFEVDPFFTDYLVDMVRSTRSFRERNQTVSVESDLALGDILVEMSSDTE
ncbi:MAG: hypothetical protein H3C43_05250 [Leptonema sp. (in: Bacteria)]|nr:hypothetical protein [Leptonema sp. (in: bacteria)]